jgi:hypothetical protein
MSSFSYTAKVLPLKGKYYGTIVELIDEEGRKSEIKIWIDDPDYSPSDRQLEDYGFANKEEAHDDGFPCDCHYESQRGYWIANCIASAINGTASTKELFKSISSL